MRVLCISRFYRPAFPRSASRETHTGEAPRTTQMPSTRAPSPGAAECSTGRQLSIFLRTRSLQAGPGVSLFRAHISVTVTGHLTVAPFRGPRQHVVMPRGRRAKLGSSGTHLLANLCDDSVHTGAQRPQLLLAGWKPWKRALPRVKLSKEAPAPGGPFLWLSRVPAEFRCWLGLLSYARFSLLFL